MSKIPLPELFQRLRKATTYDEVEDLIANLRRDNREKFDKAFFDAGELMRKTGKKQGVFLVREPENLKFRYVFRVYAIPDLPVNALNAFLDQLGTCAFVRDTIPTFKN